MDIRFSTKGWARGVAVFLSILVPSAASAQGPRLQLDHLNRLASRASEVVDVTVDAAMLELTAGFLARKETTDPKLKAALEGIKGIYVKAFEFKTDGASPQRAYSDRDVEEIRRQLAAPGWSRAISVRENGELIEVYFWRESGQNGGIAIIAAEENELVVVNIVGRVDLATLAALGPMIPKLPNRPKLIGK